MSSADFLFGPFVEFDFMRRALIGSLALAAGGTPVGAFLMLRRMSLMGDAMSHAILPGIAVGFLVAGLDVTAMAAGGIAAGLIVATAAGLAARISALKEETSLAAFYLISLAAGVIIVSMRGTSIDLTHVLFGTVLALGDDALLLIAGTATLTLVVFALIFRPLVIECVDPVFLRSVSGSGPVVHFAFLALVVINLVAGYQALGTLLAVGLLILPAASARFWTADIGVLMGLAGAIAAASCYAGLIVSFHYAIPPGPAIILTAGVFYGFSLLCGRRGGVLAQRATAGAA